MGAVRNYATGKEVLVDGGGTICQSASLRSRKVVVAQIHGQLVT